jgi:hypothetical protein
MYVRMRVYTHKHTHTQARGGMNEGQARTLQCGRGKRLKKVKRKMTGGQPSRGIKYV